ncbi:hypothetical protein CJZ71_19930 [Bacillus subtilis]|jgi:hypothetical protein|nr:hypothetical protein Q433_07600 [Bacillus subtilis subsp. subtilis str. OH 131.1]AII37912.1 hypothetical protein M036_07005 [Bacillus subtilis TO-A]AIY92626.1 hypothetical protein QU35_07410 [Bacillus subtilis subsp. subtilis str. 168]AIY96937.1 hypothetical protein QX56_07405 [Bacillus subtilis]AJE94006.1 hypothetical protein RP72_07290 [Bacillus subtilis subsp. subtilis]AJO57959.1 hypothetical protein QF06_05665 [Bacillus sp. YP1]AKC46880.1 hypothetical protein O7A_07405 [Bacillus subtil
MQLDACPMPYSAKALRLKAPARFFCRASFTFNPEGFFYAFKTKPIKGGAEYGFSPFESI